MPRGMGSVFQVVKHGRKARTWTVQYYVNGRRVRHATGTTDRKTALKILKEHVQEVSQGLRDGLVVRFEDLVAGIVRDYRVNHRDSMRHVKGRIAHLERVFGGKRIEDITPAGPSREGGWPRPLPVFLLS